MLTTIKQVNKERDEAVYARDEAQKNCDNSARERDEALVSRDKASQQRDEATKGYSRQKTKLRVTQEKLNDKEQVCYYY